MPNKGKILTWQPVEIEIWPPHLADKIINSQIQNNFFVLNLKKVRNLQTVSHSGYSDFHCKVCTEIFIHEACKKLTGWLKTSTLSELIGVLL